MFTETTVDSETARSKLVELDLASRTEPALIYVLDQGAVFDIQVLGPEWLQYPVPNCLMAMSYQLGLVGCGVEAVGVWLPQHGVVQIADTAMHCHVIEIDGPRAYFVEQDRLAIAWQLRAVVGALVGRPGRTSPHHPIVIARTPADVDQLVRSSAAHGRRLEPVTPQQAAASWPRAVRVFVHHEVVDEVAELGLAPRADVMILAPRHTAKVRAAAARLRTDEVWQWPQSIPGVVASLGRHYQMLDIANARRAR